MAFEKIFVIYSIEIPSKWVYNKNNIVLTMKYIIHLYSCELTKGRQ